MVGGFQGLYQKNLLDPTYGHLWQSEQRCQQLKLHNPEIHGYGLNKAKRGGEKVSKSTIINIWYLKHFVVVQLNKEINSLNSTILKFMAMYRTKQREGAKKYQEVWK